VTEVRTDIPDKYLGRFKALKPGAGGKDDETGTAVTFKRQDGGDIASFVIGKNPDSGRGGPSSGGSAQYVKLDSAKEQVHVVKDGFDYFMNTITMRDWLNKTDFFKPEKIKSVTVTTVKPEDNWRIYREKEGTDMSELKLADLKPGEEFDTAKGGNSGNAFSGPSFNDVAVGDAKTKSGLGGPTRLAVIETFEGFTYAIKIGNAVEQKDPSAGAGEEHYISVAVTGNFPDKMPEWQPKPEDASKTDEEKKKLKDEAEKAFNDELTKKKEKLAKESALASIVYIVPKYIVEPLLKNRAEFMKDKPAPTPPATPGTPGTPGAPILPPGSATPPVPAPTPPATGATMPKREPITATTPPIAVEIPPATKTETKKPEETKPAPKPDDKKPDAKKPDSPAAPAAPAPAEPAKPSEPAKPAEAKPAASKESVPVKPGAPNTPVAPATPGAAPSTPAPAPAPTPAPAPEKKP
jgi:hypothetical protein